MVLRPHFEASSVLAMICIVRVVHAIPHVEVLDLLIIWVVSVVFWLARKELLPHLVGGPMLHAVLICRVHMINASPSATIVLLLLRRSLVIEQVHVLEEMSVVNFSLDRAPAKLLQPPNCGVRIGRVRI